jgi:Lrp/AsnC family leucine-responsive transcriptional regulator
MMPDLDRLDRILVKALQRDARATNAQLAELVGLSESACLRRVRTLEQSGLIQGYVALVDPQKAGYPITVFVQLTLDKQSQPRLDEFEKAIAGIPEVMECYLMSGEHDYLVRLVVQDLADFERVHSHQLTRLPNVARVHSSFAVRAVTRAGQIPLR